MENVDEGNEVNAAGGPAEQLWTEARVLRKLQQGVNHALNNSGRAERVTIVNFGAKHLSRNSVAMKLFLDLKEVWTTWGLRKCQGGSRTTWLYDFEFDRIDVSKLTNGIHERYVFTLP